MDNYEGKKPEQEVQSDYKFLQEKIKERPLNKKKLLQRTLLTASLALLFGIVACITFLLLEPVLNNMIFPEEEPEVITFPQEEDEMLPENMLTEEDLHINEEPPEPSEDADDDILPENPDANTSEQSETVIAGLLSETNEEPVEEVDPYYLVNQQTQFYQQLYSKYREISTSLVTVTAVREDVDWFNTTVQSEGETAGVIIGNNNRYLLILCRKSALNKADSIQVTFCNRVSAEGTIKCYDEETNLAIVQVEIKPIKRSVMDDITVANLGSSVASSLVGTPVIVAGNVQGYNDNVCYGIITSVGNVISRMDAQYKLITTDIYSSENASGVLLNMNGQIIGILDNSYNNKDTKNMLAAIGITELKGMISNISNGIEAPHLGLYVQDISNSIRTANGLPQGAYVFDVAMDSKAMDSGIQKGDIVVRIGDKEIRGAAEYTSAIREYRTGNPITIVIKRASQEAYEEIEFDAILD